jgi:hypothetical protein
MTSPRLAALPLLLLPALLLAGCSGTASTPGSGSGAQASAKAVASAIASAQGRTAAPAVSGPIKTGDQLCALVPSGDVQAAVKADPPITTALANSGIDDEPGCGWISTNDKVILSVFLYPLKDNPFDGKKPIMAAGTLKPVSGVGELAGVNDLEFDALKGQTVVSVESIGDVDMSTDQMIALGKIIVSRLP